jgi:alkanesulfonate monooxygenase SsuD/methylene tetrahydromethanopterin reductase-like flavin-dependent oxidoreductase (luciferase family)
MSRSLAPASPRAGLGVTSDPNARLAGWPICGLAYKPGVPGIGAFITPGRDLGRALERVQLADSLGFDSAYTTHIAGRDSLTVLMAYASVSERIRLGTGVVPIFSRTPVAMAQSAATIDEFSGGRMVLGLGVSHQATVEHWYGSRIERPVAQMSEYAAVVRAILRGEDPPRADFFPTAFRFMGYQARAELPIYIAALSPAMLRLAGAIADGVTLWLCAPHYIQEVVIPEVTTGRERAGKTLEGFDIVAAVPVALTEDREAVHATLRQDLVTYASLPFYRAMLERSGFEDEIAAFDEGMAAGDLERAKAGLSDGMLDALAGVGSVDEVRGGVRRYLDAGTVSPCIGGIPATDFDAALRAVAELL